MRQKPSGFIAFLLAFTMIFNLFVQVAPVPVYGEEPQAEAENRLETPQDGLLSLEVPPEPEEEATTGSAIEEPELTQEPVVLQPAVPEPVISGARL